MPTAILLSGRSGSQGTVTTSQHATEPLGSGAGAHSAEAAEAPRRAQQEPQATVKSHSTVVALWDSLTIQRI
jgi:hypothetical protein